MIKTDTDIFDEPIFTEATTKDLIKSIDVKSGAKEIAKEELGILDKNEYNKAKKKFEDEVDSNDNKINDDKIFDIEYSKTIAGKTHKTLDNINRSIEDRNLVNTTSIVGRAKNSIAQFPVYITGGMPISVAHTISKTFERVYASFMQTVFSQNQIIDSRDANNMQFLKQFHVNLRESANNSIDNDSVFNEYYQPIDRFDEIMQEALYKKIDINDELTVEFRRSYLPNDYIFSENARMMNEPLTGISYLYEQRVERRSAAEIAKSGIEEISNEPEYILSDKKIIETNEKVYNSMHQGYDKIIKDSQEALKTAEDVKTIEALKKDITSAQRLKGELDEAYNDDDPGAVIDFSFDKLGFVKIGDDKVYSRNVKQPVMEEIIDDNGKKVSVIKKDKKGHPIEQVVKQYYTLGKTSKRVRPASVTSVDMSGVPDRPLDTPKLLKEQDIRKINGLNPYLIEASFIIRTKNSRNSSDGNEHMLDKEIKYLIGIKTVLHLISVKDLSEELRGLVMGDIKSLQKVRYKTGEISWADYMLNIKGLKNDAIKSLDSSKHWINTLKRLAEFRKTNGSMLKNTIKGITGGDVPVPNGTLILSEPDITRLINETGIDISLISNARALSRSLALMAIGIVDKTSATLKVFYVDESTDWDIQSLASLDADIARSENSQLMKELNKAVTK